MLYATPNEGPEKRPMNLWLMAMVVFTLALSLLTSCQPANTKPVKPNFAVSTQFDGQWYGERINITPSPRCQPTAISGSVTQGFVDFTLHYNQTQLTGWIAYDGKLKLHSDASSRHDYFFSGDAQGNEIKGAWSVTTAPCKGAWSVTRQ